MICITIDKVSDQWYEQKLQFNVQDITKFNILNNDGSWFITLSNARWSWSRDINWKAQRARVTFVVNNGFGCMLHRGVNMMIDGNVLCTCCRRIAVWSVVFFFIIQGDFWLKVFNYNFHPHNYYDTTRFDVYDWKSDISIWWNGYHLLWNRRIEHYLKFNTWLLLKFMY